MRTLSPAFIEKANARRARRSAIAQMREEEAITLHKGGLTYQQIAEKLQVSRQFAHVIVKRGLARTAKKGERANAHSQQ